MEANEAGVASNGGATRLGSGSGSANDGERQRPGESMSASGLGERLEEGGEGHSRKRQAQAFCAQLPRRRPMLQVQLPSEVQRSAGYNRGAQGAGRQ